MEDIEGDLVDEDERRLEVVDGDAAGESEDEAGEGGVRGRVELSYSG